MTLNEILLKENEGKKFLCRDNSFIVRNDCGTLLYLNKTFDDRNSTLEELHYFKSLGKCKL